MDLSYGAEYEAFREEVQAFVDAAWPEASRARAASPEERGEFIRSAVERGYLYRSVPKRYGGSEQPFDPLRAEIVSEVFDAAHAPFRLGPQGVGMIVPTLLECGADWQKQRFIPETLTGEFVWCQGYSEPGSGSDLASLRSTARLEGDSWVIDGQKIWTSDAADAHYMFGLFRTEPDAPKHGGISYLLLEMNQPGIEVRPLRQLTGATHFYEVFFDGARTPADWMVGERGQGWQVTRVNLKYERNLGGGNRLRAQFDALVETARRATLGGRPAIEDPRIRQRLAEIYGFVRCGEASSLRRLSAVANGDEGAVALSLLVGKLFGSDVIERITELGYELLGADGLRAPRISSWQGIELSGGQVDWVDQYLFALGGRIAAGSSNIQRNVIGERGLGLPRDLRAGETR